MTRIIDCCMIYKELELYQVRLHELFPVVDSFLAVEAKYTHSGKVKGEWEGLEGPFYLKEKTEKDPSFLANYRSKMVVAAMNIGYPYSRTMARDILELYSSTKSRPGARIQRFLAGDLRERSWAYENAQRQAILRSLHAAPIQDSDWILISDCDEIPSRAAIEEFAAMDKKLPFYAFDQRNSRGHINTLDANVEGDLINGGRWQGTKALRWGFMKNLDLTDQVRYRQGYAQEFPGCVIGAPEKVTDVGAGWHFGYMGDVQRVLDKFRSFAHTEHEGKTEEEVREALEKGENFFKNPDGSVNKKIVIPFDDSYPIYMKEHPEQFEQFVFQGHRYNETLSEG